MPFDTSKFCEKGCRHRGVSTLFKSLVISCNKNEFFLRLQNYAEAFARLDELHALTPILQRNNHVGDHGDIQAISQQAQSLTPMLTLVSTVADDADLTHSDVGHRDRRRLCGKTRNTDATTLSNHLNSLLGYGPVTCCVEDALGALAAGKFLNLLNNIALRAINRDSTELLCNLETLSVCIEAGYDNLADTTSLLQQSNHEQTNSARADYNCGFTDLRIYTLYSVIAMVVSSMALDRVVYGMDYSKVALIITEKYEAIATAIDSQLDRGVTLLKGQGYYKRQDKMVLLSAVKRKQLAELKELVMDIDPDAFIILQDAHQVLGDGFKRYDRNEL